MYVLPETAAQIELCDLLWSVFSLGSFWPLTLVGSADVATNSGPLTPVTCLSPYAVIVQARILLRVRLESETSDLRVRVERRVKLRL